MTKEELHNAMLAHITEALGYAELHEEFKTKIMKAVSHFMPHTCTATERKFLDKIRKGFYYNDEDEGLTNRGSDYDILYQETFKGIPLKELANG